MREDAGWCPDGHVRRSRGSRWVVDHTECGTRATHEQMPSGAFACEPRAAAAESPRALVTYCICLYDRRLQPDGSGEGGVKFLRAFLNRDALFGTFPIRSIDTTRTCTT